MIEIAKVVGVLVEQSTIDQNLNEALGNFGDKNSDSRLAIEKYHSSSSAVPKSASRTAKANRNSTGERLGNIKDVSFNLQSKDVSALSVAANADVK